jgi:hypothetical protein
MTPELIVWMDSCGLGEGWQSIEDARRSTTAICQTAGFVLSEDESAVIVAGHVAEESERVEGEVGGVLAIPKCCIISREKLIRGIGQEEVMYAELVKEWRDDIAQYRNRQTDSECRRRYNEQCTLLDKVWVEVALPADQKIARLAQIIEDVRHDLREMEKRGDVMAGSMRRFIEESLEAGA